MHIYVFKFKAQNSSYQLNLALKRSNTLSRSAQNRKSFAALSAGAIACWFHNKHIGQLG